RSIRSCEGGVTTSGRGTRHSNSSRWIDMWLSAWYGSSTATGGTHGRFTIRGGPPPASSRLAYTDWSGRSATRPARMPREKTIGKPCAGNPHARFERGIQEPGLARAPRLISTNGRSRDLPQQPSRPRLHDRPHLPGVHGAVPQDRPARLRHHPDLLRPRPALRRAEEPQALPLRLPQPGHLLRAGDQRDPRRPRPGAESEAYDRRGRFPGPGRDLHRGPGHLRGEAPAGPRAVISPPAILARRFVA